MALKNNTWKVNQWYDQAVAGNVSYSGEQQLFMAGQNTPGALGQNDRTNYSSPVQIYGGGSTWSEVQTPNAGSRPVALKTDGTLWVWGNDSDGSLGLNDTTARSSPTQIGSDTDWSVFAAGTNSAIAVKTDGTLWAWGYNNVGQLGQNQGSPSYQARSSPIQIPGEWSQNISADASISAAVKTDGTLWMWGSNSNGRMGQNEAYSPSKKGYSSPVQVGSDTTWSTSKGHLHVSSGSIAIKTDGTLWTWGYNGAGGLGLNNTTTYSSPVQVPGTTWDYAMTFAGSSAAVKTDGTLWSWGYNNLGMLGHNNQTQYSSPKQVGSGTDWSKTWLNETVGCGLKTDGTAWMWGRNSQKGQQGHNNLTDYSSPKQVPGNYIWLDINNYNAAWIKEL